MECDIFLIILCFKSVITKNIIKIKKKYKTTNYWVWFFWGHTLINTIKNSYNYFLVAICSGTEIDLMQVILQTTLFKINPTSKFRHYNTTFALTLIVLQITKLPKTIKQQQVISLAASMTPFYGLRATLFVPSYPKVGKYLTKGLQYPNGNVWVE